MKEYIKKAAFFQCVSYTLVSFTNAVINFIGGKETNNASVMAMFGICLIVSLILPLYEYFEGISPLAMIFLQYLLSCAGGALLLYLFQRNDPFTAQEWLENYLTFTIPYIILTGIYYISVFADTKKKDELIREIQKQKPTT